MAIGTKKIGQCEVCDKENIEVVNTPGNIEMCAQCKADDDKIREQTKSVDMIINQSKEINSHIELKQDIFNAATVPVIQVKAAIDADESIPADQKEYKFTQYCYEQFLHMQKVAFDKKQEYEAAENEKRMWQAQAQSAAGKLRMELREHFKNLNMNYNPSPAKVVKPATPGKPKVKKPSAKECREAAIKYNIAAMAPQVQMMTITRNLSAEDAAKELASLMAPKS